MKDTIIRNEAPEDIEAIAEITREAFRADTHGNHNEEFIIAALRRAGLLTLSLVAERDARIIGHVAFSPVTVADGSLGWFGLGPIAVAPEFQRQGIGQALVRQGLDELREQGAQGCVLLGDPLYYGRFGFANNPNLVLADVPQKYFLSLAFGNDQAHGEVVYHDAFNAEG